MARIAPSIIAADFANLGEEARAVESAGADWLHVDIMDGLFVPQLTMGPLAVAALARTVRLPLDVHLMISDPDRYLEEYAAAGAARLTVHLEGALHLHRTLSKIRQLGKAVGIAINPATPLAALVQVLPLVDQVLLMTVDPGFSGQSFITQCLSKIADARSMLAGMGRSVDLVVDGGVTLANAVSLTQAGASVLVAGQSVFGFPSGPADGVRALRTAITA